MPLLGPTAGPLLGGILIQYRTWQDTFFLCSILTFLFLILGVLCLPETFGPVILYRRRLDQWRKDGYAPPKSMRDSQMDRLRRLIRVDLARPFVLLGTQPIIQTLALYMGLLFGLNHLTISTFHALWREVYHESDITSSLNYIAITLGFLGGCESAGPLNDKVCCSFLGSCYKIKDYRPDRSSSQIYRYLKRQNNGLDLPEYRIWLMIPGSIFVPFGLLWYGWSATYQLHWIMPDIGITIYSFGLLMAYQCIQAYVLDCYPVYAASAMGALTVLRSLAGFTLPIFAPVMYKSLGYGWASTMLALVALIIGSVAPWLLKTKGPYLREKSPYAAGEVNLVL